MIVDCPIFQWQIFHAYSGQEQVQKLMNVGLDLEKTGQQQLENGSDW